jgi:hypothetical protein
MTSKATTATRTIKAIIQVCPNPNDAKNERDSARAASPYVMGMPHTKKGAWPGGHSPVPSRDFVKQVSGINCLATPLPTARQAMRQDPRSEWPA